MIRVSSLILVTIFVSACDGKRFPSVLTLFKDKQIREDLKKERYEEALAGYFSLLEEDEQRVSTHSNIGVLLNQLQKTDEALSSLKHALSLAEKSKKKEDLFLANYNLGVYYGSKQKIKEALQHYQDALDLIPTSIEIKTNIELLIQQEQQNQQNQKSSGSGQGQQNKPDQDKDKNEGKDKKDEDKDSDKQKDKEQKPQEKQGSPKYKPRPFEGDQLSEGDVKKILDELKSQEQKIRANFDKKENEKGKSKNNEKDW